MLAKARKKPPERRDSNGTFNMQFAPDAGIMICGHGSRNQHAADENLRLGNLWRGVTIFAVVLARLGDAL